MQVYSGDELSLYIPRRNLLVFLPIATYPPSTKHTTAPKNADIGLNLSLEISYRQKADSEITK
jgi:hypothetical protein